MIINGFVPSDKVFESNFGTENKTKETSNGNSFAETLKSSLDDINTQQVNADNLSNSFIKGDDVDVADVMLAGEEAKVSLQYAVQVRNKLVDAYQEIMRMQL
jgi:flagellar hook-basal body complex protein FliE